MRQISAAEIRRLVAERARNQCEYCRCSFDFSSSPYAVDHISPRVGGGTSDLENLAWSCQGCNGHKLTATAAQDLITGEQAALYHPRQQNWAEHFQWSENGLTLLGTTPTGRATIERLQLNRPSVINLRRVLTGFGLHPPRG